MCKSITPRRNSNDVLILNALHLEANGDEIGTFLIPNTLVSSVYDRLLLQLQCHTLAVTLRPFLAIFQQLPINSNEYLQFPTIFTYFRPTSAFFGNFQQYYLYQDSSRSFPTTFGSFLTASSPGT